MKIYTKTGDDGGTGLFGGPRVRKDDPRIEAYGSVDELNAVIGLIRAEILPAGMDDLLRGIQNRLFDVGAELATPDPEKHGTRIVNEGHIAILERAIDHCEETLSPLRQFVLPGGTRAAALLHLGRTVCRRAERRLITFADVAEVAPLLIIYLNRLSDLLFVMARAANQSAGVSDVPWEKG